MSTFDQLKKYTTVVADTGDFESMKQFAPQDATTNPNLILAATKKQDYGYLLDKAVTDVRPSGLSGEAFITAVADHLLILFGTEILKIVPGRVSTEIDARLSFDTEALIERARQIIALYEKQKIGRERVLIKLASTWEGIKAAEQLQKEGIRCNMTLLFSLPQAVASAEVGAQLISPFVGRIYDWFKKETGKEYKGAEDPGVQSVTHIYNYYKKFGYPTEVMGASFRNVGQIIELAGCDFLTISPHLMEELASMNEPLERKLSPEKSTDYTAERLELDEKTFRFLLNEDAMATDKTAEGIRKFSADIVTLEKMISEKI